MIGTGLRLPMDWAGAAAMKESDHCDTHRHPRFPKSEEIVWQDHWSTARIEAAAKRQVLKSVWPIHRLQVDTALVTTNGQALKTAGQAGTLQALFEILPKCQVLQIAWQTHVFQLLVEVLAKSQVLQAAWQSYTVHALVKKQTQR